MMKMSETTKAPATIKIYSKQLNSLAELKKEKQRLCRLRDSNAPQTWLSFKEKAANTSKENEPSSSGNFLLDAISTFTDSASLLSPLLSFAPNILGSKPAKKVGSGIWALAKEIGGSYLKWKVLQLGFKGIKSFIKK